MRSMPPVMRRGNRRACRQRQSREKNRNRFDGLVHITPATFFFSRFAGALFPLTKSQESDLGESDNTSFLHRTVRVPINRPLPSR